MCCSSAVIRSLTLSANARTRLLTAISLPFPFSYCQVSLAKVPNFLTNGLVNFATRSQTGQYGGPVLLICLLHCNSWPPPTVNSLCQTRGFAGFGYVTKACIEISVKFPFIFSDELSPFSRDIFQLRLPASPAFVFICRHLMCRQFLF